MYYYLELSDKDKVILTAEFGNDVIAQTIIEITSGYGFDSTRWTSVIDEKKAIENLLSRFKLDASERNALNKATRGKELYEILKPLQRTEKQEALFQHLSKYRDQSISLKAIDVLSAATPKLFTFLTMIEWQVRLLLSI
ncbi:MAG: hypothetical protein WDO15_04890 [Bacteroidota bacterium]